MAFVKIVEELNPKILERKVNEILKAHNGYIHDIKYQTTYSTAPDAHVHYSAMIIINKSQL